jgi:Asp-tRNA(Asn)/Glu-tRNA(Gln) amidotransferase A subunit family amidase
MRMDRIGQVRYTLPVLYNRVKIAFSDPKNEEIMSTAPFPLYETVVALRDGQMDLISYIHAACDRIDEVDAQIQALLPEENRRQRLLHEAKLLLERYPNPADRPPLFGVLVGVKDIFRVEGFATRAGSGLPHELFGGEEAVVVTRLKQAGALIAGKTVTTEFAYLQPGPTRNPHNTGHTPGGSSSGSAAGVSAGEFQLAIGTQTIGSVIRPAAFCGVVGFKPSYDRIPTPGLLYFSKSFDHVGLFTQDLDGMALAASVLCDNWHGEAAQTASTRKPVLAVPIGPYLDSASAEGRAAFEQQITDLAQNGFSVKRLPFFEDFEDLERQHKRMMAAEAMGEHEAWYADHADRYSRHMHEIMETGRSISADEVAQARAARIHLRQEITDTLAQQGADLWVAPPAPGPAPEGLGSTGNSIMNLPWTNAGVPALTLPMGSAANGLPLGLQLVAPFGQDEQLLAWARLVAEAKSG